MKAQQLDMFGGASVPRETKSARSARPARPSIDQRFEAFHEANPHVLTEMLRLAVDKLERGERRIGVKALWEEIRGRIQVAGVNSAGLHKLNNDFTAIYAREIIARDPRLAEVIELRKRKAKR